MAFSDLDTSSEYSFQAPAVQVGQHPDPQKSFGNAALDPRLQQQLNMVLKPEEQGHRAIQVDSSQLDNIDRIGADVRTCEGSPGLLGDIMGAAKNLAADVTEARNDLTGNDPAPVVQISEPTPELQKTWTPSPNMMA
ncbi:MAG: hypothetical protein R3D88_09525 [Alphaproteobacteria bacterium]|nr:hypothetical protein [Alphaproteobacteria bacterium]